MKLLVNVMINSLGVVGQKAIAQCEDRQIPLYSDRSYGQTKSD
ncbi:MAG: hypothetical protein QNJ32_27455 [Xenococcaceae cyanobacterium MO_167.B27]|nr:hypothetical protein [Xenococcaceae cyanobacterium MO_167.B27]